MTMLHKVQLFLKEMGVSRFLYAPRTPAEVFGALFGWMFISGTLALAYILYEWLATPDYKRYDPNSNYSIVFRVCVVYVLICVLAFLFYCVLSVYVPSLRAFFALSNYQ